MVRTFIKILGIIWASPNTCLGLTVGLIGLLFRGKIRWRRGCIEFHDGLVKFLLRKTPVGAIAMTLGHTILGQTGEDLDAARDHEHIHVQQYERWGPFFLPAYFWFSFILWIQKKESYRANPFEKEAYDKTEIDYGDCSEHDH